MPSAVKRQAQSGHPALATRPTVMASWFVLPHWTASFKPRYQTPCNHAFSTCHIFQKRLDTPGSIALRHYEAGTLMATHGQRRLHDRWRLLLLCNKPSSPQEKVLSETFSLPVGPWNTWQWTIFPLPKTTNRMQFIVVIED